MLIHQCLSNVHNVRPSQEGRRFFSARHVYNRIRKNSANVDGYRRDQAEARRRKDSGEFEDVWGPKGRYRGIQSGKSRADRRSRAEGLRNGRSGFMAALNPNERSFPPPFPSGSPRDLLSIENMSYLQGLYLERDFVPKNSRRFYSSNHESKHLFRENSV